MGVQMRQVALGVPGARVRARRLEALEVSYEITVGTQPPEALLARMKAGWTDELGMAQNLQIVEKDKPQIAQIVVSCDPQQSFPPGATNSRNPCHVDTT